MHAGGGRGSAGGISGARKEYKSETEQEEQELDDGDPFLEKGVVGQHGESV